MTTRPKPSKQQKNAEDQKQSRNFLIAVAIITVLLMLLMYLVFKG